VDAVVSLMYNILSIGRANVFVMPLFLYEEELVEHVAVSSKVTKY
jgi:hypothetical protein